MGATTGYGASWSCSTATTDHPLADAERATGGEHGDGVAVSSLRCSPGRMTSRSVELSHRAFDVGAGHARKQREHDVAML